MSRSHWLPIITIAGIALATGPRAQPVSDDEAAQLGAAGAQESAPSEIAGTLPPALESQIERIAAALEAIEADRYVAADQERAARNLDAQEGTAKWAEYMFWVAGLQAFLSFGGLIALLYTIGLNREATKAAVKAAEAAETAVKVAQKTAKQQLRAYLSTAKSRVTLGEDGTVKGFVRIANGGQTPAYNFQVRSAIGTENYPLNVPLPAAADLSAPERSIATVGPGRTVTVHLELKEAVNEHDRGLIAERSAAIIVFGTATYRDVFGDNWATNFQLYYHGPWGGTRRLVVAEEGNCAT